jgi:alpha-galactosidase
MRVHWAYLPFLKGTFQIRDLWQKKGIGKTDVDFSADIPSHDVVLLRLSPVKQGD